MGSIKLILFGIAIALGSQTASAINFDWIKNVADQRDFLFGPTNSNAAIGNSGLSVGISKRGEITALRWPSPSHFDQLTYMTPVARVGIHKEPYKGAKANAGVFSGIRYELRGTTYVSWFRDRSWESNQKYMNENSNVVVQTYKRKDLGLEVRIRFVVHPEWDVLAIDHELRIARNSPIRNPYLMFYENLAANQNRIPFIPVAEWILDFRNDYAAIYDHDLNAIVHFTPEKIPFLSRNQRLRENFKETTGMFAAVSGYEPPDQFQVGRDRELGCLKLFGRREKVQDAFVDAFDGELSGDDFSICQTNGALSWKWNQRKTVFITFANTYEELSGRLEKARTIAFREYVENSNRHWKKFLSTARLPKTRNPLIRKLAKRALVSIKTGTDRDSGSIIASVAVQPPYAYDWPRDGAFFNYALDLAGYHQMVEKHNDFTARVQRKKGIKIGPWQLVPPGQFDTDYFTDGMPGSPIFFEIDNTALAMWTFAEHAEELEGEDQIRYLKKIWPALRLGVNGLEECRNKRTKLQCLSFEGDHPYPSRGLVGAASVAIGMQAGLKAAKMLGVENDETLAWQKRLDEVLIALDKKFYNEAEGYYETGFLYPRGFVSWILWPLGRGLLPKEHLDKHAEAMLELALRRLGGEPKFSLYDAEALASLASYWRDDPEKLAEVRKGILLLAERVATPDTYHFSEIYTPDGEGRFLARNVVPHNATASMFFIAAMLAF